MNDATYRFLREAGLSHDDIELYYDLDDLDETGEPEGDPEQQLMDLAQTKSLRKYGRPLERIKLSQREHVFRLAAKELEYTGTVRQLMGPPPGNAGGFASYGTAPYGDETSMGLRPHQEAEFVAVADDLMAEAERIAEQVAPGHTLADLAQNDPALHQRLLTMAAAAVNYRGAAGAPPAYSNWPGTPADDED